VNEVVASNIEYTELADEIGNKIKAEKEAEKEAEIEREKEVPAVDIIVSGENLIVTLQEFIY
jgi:hypothetical protein